MRRAATTPLRQMIGLLAGIPTGLIALGWACVAWAAADARARKVTASLVRLERARLAAWYDHRPGGGRGGRTYLVLRGLVGLLGGYLAGTGLFVAALLLYGGAVQLLSGDADLVPLAFPGVRLTGSSWAYGLVLGAIALALSSGWCATLIAAERRLADRFLGTDPNEAMARRIAELTATRSGIVRAVDEERRRIERDLHDGVQQRGVALAMLLGRARHTGDPALVDEAYAEARLLLDELRGVAWQIYPTALDTLGLRAALTEVADRSAVPVRVEYTVAERLAPEIETAVYFVAREAITNANKHAEAGMIVVEVREEEGEVAVTIADDGRGGAVPGRGGLSGLERRVRALDGSLAVESPEGGPTRVSARLPCG
ncbi:sensor histidine kinase [Nonomuraea sp. NPDC059194]|uniref:sensor histidine kinase n=1 Tax=Nonomuraea sp. NPDC059194 TaxID=3346764 RepID=UPI0036C25874